MDYLKRTRRVSPEIMMRAEQYLNLGYQRILTFERPGGGFDWWGNGPALIWLTAYGVQQLAATSKVRDIDKGVIERAQAFLVQKQDPDGSWGIVGDTHSETIAQVSNPRLALTAYVTWSLAESGYTGEPVQRALAYLFKHYQDARTNPYLLSMMANAFVFGAPNDMLTSQIFDELARLRIEKDDLVSWQPVGQTATCAYGDSATIETTAMVAYAMIKGQSMHVNILNKALNYLVKQKNGSGTWGSTQATILVLKALVASDTVSTQGGNATVDILLNGKAVGGWKIGDANRDVMQLLDLGTNTTTGTHQLQFQVQGNANVMYQVVGRYYEPWREEPPERKPIEIAVTYDRDKLVKNDILVATATMRYNGLKPTFMVILDLGIPPGFSVDPGDFAELLGEQKIARYAITARQITLYLGNVGPGAVFTCRYHLKAKYPLRAKTPKSTAYEYYSPEVLAESRPTDLVVEEK